MALAVGLALGLAVACGDDGVAGGAGPVTTDAWARPTAPGAETAAFYFALENTGDGADRLTAASAPPCASTMLHRSSMVDGVMQMAPATDDDLTLTAGESVRFEPAGLHVMCLGLDQPLVEGQEVPLELTFEQAGTIQVTAVVEDR